MPMRGYPSTRLLCLLGIIVSALWVQPATATTRTPTDVSSQAIVLLSGRSLLEHRLPAFVQIQPGRFLATRVVLQACTALRLKGDSLVLYLPDSQRCESMDSFDRYGLRQQIHRLTGRWLAHDLRESLQQKPFLALAPAIHAHRLAISSCTCPANTPPTGSVTCTAQTRTANTPIGTITFVANDADGDTLSGSFSYQRDAGQAQSGLPTSLLSACTPGSGSLQCTINGTAPDAAGIVQLNLSVSDGSATLPLNSLLEILAPVDGRIFADGFEYMGCR